MQKGSSSTRNSSRSSSSSSSRSSSSSSSRSSRSSSRSSSFSHGSSSVSNRRRRLQSKKKKRRGRVRTGGRRGPTMGKARRARAKEEAFKGLNSKTFFLRFENKKMITTELIVAVKRAKK